MALFTGALKSIQRSGSSRIARWLPPVFPPNQRCSPRLATLGIWSFFAILRVGLVFNQGIVGIGIQLCLLLNGGGDWLWLQVNCSICCSANSDWRAISWLDAVLLPCWIAIEAVTYIFVLPKLNWLFSGASFGLGSLLGRGNDHKSHTLLKTKIAISGRTPRNSLAVISEIRGIWFSTSFWTLSAPDEVPRVWLSVWKLWWMDVWSIPAA